MLRNPVAIAPERFWFAFTVRSGQERKVVETIRNLAARRGLQENILAVTPTETSKTGRLKARWSGLIFVGINAEHDLESLYHSVRTTPGVTGVVNNPSIPLTYAEISALTEVSSSSTELDRHDNLAEGTVRSLTSGPFAGLDIAITSITGAKVTGTVLLFGRETVVTIERTQLG